MSRTPSTALTTHPRLVHDLTAAARCGVPLEVVVRTPSGRAIVFRGAVAEVAIGHVVVRVRRGRDVVVKLGDVVPPLRRLDGRPFAPRTRDGREQLAERADAHESNGGLE